MYCLWYNITMIDFEKDPSHQIPRGPEIVPYTPHDITRIIVNSFRFSRGSHGLQVSMLHVIASGNHARFTDEAFEAATVPTLEAVHRIYTNPKLHLPTESPDLNENAVTQYLRLLKDDTYWLPPKNKDLEDLCVEAIKSDLEWVPGYNPDRSRPPRSSYMSNVLKHALIGRSTGQPEFDHVFSVIGSRLTDTAREDKETRLNFHRKDKFPRIAQAHVKEHPNDRELLRAHPAMPPFEPRLAKLIGLLKK